MTDESDRPRYPPPQFAPAADTREPIADEAADEAAEDEPADEPAEAIVDEPVTAPVSAPLSLPPVASEAAVAVAPDALVEAPVPPPTRIRRAAPPPDLDDDDDEDRPRSRRTAWLALGGLLVAALGIAALVVLGRLNAARYAIRCDAKEVVAERGRSFPPWGTSALGGEAWRPIAIPANVQCIPVETEDVAVLGDAFRKVLVERADALLTAREVTQIDPAAAMLEQALLHARSDSAAHKSARQDIQRMLGDVGYWRASAKLRTAAATLGEAAAEFEAASQQRPRHVSDASAWANYIRKVIDELRAGPAGAKQTQLAPPDRDRVDRPPAPAGTELPVEPSADSANSGGSAAPPAAPPPPDAGVPSGGVLL